MSTHASRYHRDSCSLLVAHAAEYKSSRVLYVSSWPKQQSASISFERGSSQLATAQHPNIMRVVIRGTRANYINLL